MTKNDMERYVQNCGDLFQVLSIDTIRDGGTRQIVTSKDSYYVHKDNATIHTEYPPMNSNLLKDELCKLYLLDRIQVYIERSEADIEHYKSLYNKMEYANKTKPDAALYQAKSVAAVNLPNGKYFGDWCGYTVKLQLPEWKDIPIEVNNGIRGLSVNETIEIIDEWLYILN